jgi:hypothetical protein
MWHMTDELNWLQQWYSAHCDGEWEHSSGITIDTIDNPGWSLKICVEGTELASTPFEPVKTEVSETDWDRCRVTDRKEGSLIQSSPNYRRFEGFGGASNLPTSSGYSEPGSRPNDDDVTGGSMHYERAPRFRRSKPDEAPPPLGCAVQGFAPLRRR